ncbi:hypothetical protein [Trueperella pecoris]|uniref:Uncharacterized protein n=1 Tax=Trueperella pecoris TaxID=2733571 RepID=A0A7M1QVF4_9ACTO|nr:hypothetical protein [Trueperella pecoris]QOR46030.1 hypothetical protein INS88_02065 [Trueperella pecoris]
MLVLRVRGVIAAWCFLALLILLTAMVPQERFDVIGRPGVVNVLWPLVLSASGAVTMFLGRWRDSTEAIAPRAAWRRLADFGYVLAGALVFSLPTAVIGVQGIVLRDAVFYVSLAVALGPVLRSASWLCGVGGGLVYWVQGVNEWSEPAWWALPLAPANDVGSWVATLGVMVAAAIIAVGRTGNDREGQTP